jgi:outer membrane protein TolC
LQQQIADAVRQRDAARRSFNLLRNQPVDAPITLADDSTLTAADTLARNELLAWANSHREELQQADGGIRIARAQQRIVGAEFLPSVAMSATYGVQGDKYRFNRNSDVAQANLVFSWNLLNGGQDVARREQAKYAHEEATYRRREAERGIEIQVINALDAVSTARSALGSANDRLESARRAFTLVERRYAEGLATQIEFLSARASFTSAALNQVFTRYTLAARRVELERAAALRALPN